MWISNIHIQCFDSLQFQQQEKNPEFDDDTYMKPKISDPNEVEYEGSERINLAARNVVTMAAESNQMNSSSGLPNSERIDINDYHDYERHVDVNELSGASNIDTRM